MIQIETGNRSGIGFPEQEAESFALAVLECAEGVTSTVSSGLWFVAPPEITRAQA